MRVKFTFPGHCTATLIKHYQWSLPTSNWGDVRVAGIYMGIETQGRGITWFEVEDWRLYEVAP